LIGSPSYEEPPKFPVEEYVAPPPVEINLEETGDEVFLRRQRMAQEQGNYNPPPPPPMNDSKYDESDDTPHDTIQEHPI
jgi:hypothetical protein